MNMKRDSERIYYIEQKVDTIIELLKSLIDIIDKEDTSIESLLGPAELNLLAKKWSWSDSDNGE